MPLSSVRVCYISSYSLASHAVSLSPSLLPPPSSLLSPSPSLSLLSPLTVTLIPLTVDHLRTSLSPSSLFLSHLTPTPTPSTTAASSLSHSIPRTKTLTKANISLSSPVTKRRDEEKRRREETKTKMPSQPSLLSSKSPSPPFISSPTSNARNRLDLIFVHHLRHFSRMAKPVEV